jgi:hypothetical protein
MSDTASFNINPPRVKSTNRAESISNLNFYTSLVTKHTTWFYVYNSAYDTTPYTIHEFIDLIRFWEQDNNSNLLLKFVTGDTVCFLGDTERIILTSLGLETVK